MKSLYVPLTAHPWHQGKQYREYAPSPALAPYIRCYWTAEEGTIVEGTVIPDTCADIIVRFDALGRMLAASFCCLDDCPVRGTFNVQPATFGIRMYGWAVTAFSADSVKGLKNARMQAEEMFPGITHQLLEPLIASGDTTARIALAERWLLARLRPERVPALVLDAVGEMIHCHGNQRMVELGRRLHLSSRQLERLFAEAVGLSPKRLNDLIRYQSLWRAMLTPGYSALDEAARLGYTDQAHLLREFRRFHGMGRQEALRVACASNAQELLI